MEESLTALSSSPATDEALIFVEEFSLQFQLEFYKSKTFELLNQQNSIIQSLLKSFQCLQNIHTRFTDEFSILEFIKPEKLVLDFADLLQKLEIAVAESEELRKKEKRELESRIESSIEENRDIQNLLKAALIEKAATEKKIKKEEGDQRRSAILQMAGRGLQKLGFRFMVGSATESGTDSISDSDEDEELVSVVSAVETTMKNLRFQITDLKRSIEDSRSEREQLRRLGDEQDQKIRECSLRIKALEEKESILTHKVDELMIELRATEEEAIRWREACELEAEAGKTSVQNCQMQISVLKDELGRTRSELEASNNKLQLKEKLIKAAVAAQKAAEATVTVADRRAAALQERVEELMRQADEDDRKNNGGTRKRVRRICWPWNSPRLPPVTFSAPLWLGSRSTRSLPEMKALEFHV